MFGCTVLQETSTVKNSDEIINLPSLLYTAEEVRNSDVLTALEKAYERDEVRGYNAFINTDPEDSEGAHGISICIRLENSKLTKTELIDILKAYGIHGVFNTKVRHVKYYLWNQDDQEWFTIKSIPEEIPQEFQIFSTDATQEAFEDYFKDQGKYREEYLCYIPDTEVYTLDILKDDDYLIIYISSSIFGDSYWWWKFRGNNDMDFALEKAKDDIKDKEFIFP